MDNNQMLEELTQRIKAKPDQDEFIAQVRENPPLIPLLLEIIRQDPGTAKFFCGKVIRILSEEQPQLVYPFFAEIAALIPSGNNFIRWGAIITVANLVRVDDNNHFEAIYADYFDLIDDGSMITAANVVGNAWKIMERYPDRREDITRRMLRVTDNTYFTKGQPSPECRNVLIGHVIDCFDRCFETSGTKPLMADFVKSQTANPRKQVALKAATFLKKHAIEA